MYVGPGAYESAEQLNKLQRPPCSAVLRKSSQLGPVESKENCYVMAGHVLKFEPGLLKYYARDPKSKMTKKEMFKQFGNLTHSQQSLSLALDLNDPKYVHQLK